MYEKQDAKNSHRDYGMEKKFGSGLRHNRTLLSLVPGVQIVQRGSKWGAS